MNKTRRQDKYEDDGSYQLFSRKRDNSVNDDIERSLSTTLTGEIMDICKIKIIGPFNIMLTMVGWRSLTTHFQRHEKYSKLIRCVDKAVLLLFISLLLFSYIYQIMVCRFEMNVNDKLITLGPKQTTHPMQNVSTVTYLSVTTPLSSSNESYYDESYILCNHISTTYVIPDLFHFIAYIIGIIHYRINENEDIYGLMEKTLQYSSTLGIRKKPYSKVTKMLSIWMIMAVIWVILAIINHVLYDISSYNFASPFYIFKMKPYDNRYMRNIKHVFFFLDFLGYIIYSIVTVTIVFNYTIYCELIKFYIEAISKKIEIRCIKLKTVKNDLLNVSGTICLINGMIGKMMSLIFILQLNMLIVGIIILLLSDNNNTIELVFRVYFVIHLLPLIITALIQCVRVNHSIKSFKKLGRHMSVFGYRKESQKQLDSFLLFTMSYTSRAKLMTLSLEWWQLIVFLFLLGMALITMIQTGIMDKAPLFYYL